MADEIAERIIYARNNYAKFCFLDKRKKRISGYAIKNGL